MLIKVHVCLVAIKLATLYVCTCNNMHQGSSQASDIEEAQETTGVYLCSNKQGHTSLYDGHDD